MKKILASAIALVCLHTNMYATPSLSKLVKTFRHTDNPQLIIEELQNHKVPASDFVRLAAQQKIQQALQTFQVSCLLTSQDMQTIEDTLSAPTTEGTLRYNTPQKLREKLPRLKQIIARNKSLFNENCTIYYGRSNNVQTVARPQDNGSYKHELYLPESFVNQIPSEQDAILAHECAHIKQHHNERLRPLQLHNLQLFCLEKGISYDEATPLFHDGTYSLDKAINSDTLKTVRKAQEYEADWLALLHNPQNIKAGMESLLKHEKHDPYHPSKEKRLAWIRKIVALLEAEKAYAQTVHSS